MKAKIIQIDTHDTNSGILYSTEEITTAIDALKENSGFGVLGIPSDIVLDLNQVCLDWNNMKIEDGWLVADIRILDTPYGRLLKDMGVDYRYTVKPIMLATLSENKTASGIKIVGLWVDIGEI